MRQEDVVRLPSMPAATSAGSRRRRQAGGLPAIAINLADITIKGSWAGPGRLHLVPHVNAPVADLPVRRFIGAHHFLADVTLPSGRIVYDYLTNR
jgi:acetoacetate decarboxylase